MAGRPSRRGSALTIGTFTVFPDSSALIVRGEDRVDFVQGQLANDVRNIEPGNSVRSLVLNLRGQALADVGVVGTDDAFVIVAEDNMRDWLTDTFDQHIIFDQVALEKHDDYVHLTVQGAGAANVSDTLRAAGAVHVWERNRTSAGGVDVLVPQASFTAIQAALVEAEFVEASLEEHTRERILAGLPLATQDAGEGVLPQEAGLEGALSYRKGCYLGQEIMARIEARGNLRRHLVRIVVPSGAELPGRSDIRNEDGRKVGVIGSQAPLKDGQRIALAVVRNDLEPSTALFVGEEKVEIYVPNS